MHFRRLGGLRKRLKAWDLAMDDLVRSDEEVASRLKSAVEHGGTHPSVYDDREITGLTQRVLADARSGEPQRLSVGRIG